MRRRRATNEKGFLSHLFSVQYDMKAGENLTITPRFAYKRQSTWRALSKTSPDGRSLIEHWDGEEWSIVASPNGSGSRTELEAVAVAGPDLWTVGDSFNGESSERGRAIAIAMRFSRAAMCPAS